MLLACVVAGLAIVGVSVLLGGVQLWLDYVTVVRAGAGAELVDPRNLGPVSLLGQATGIEGDALRVAQAVVTLAAAALTVLAAVRVKDPVASLAVAFAASLVVLPVTWYHYPVALVPIGLALAITRPASRPWVAAAMAVAGLAIAIGPLLWVAVAIIVVAAFRVPAPEPRSRARMSDASALETLRRPPIPRRPRDAQRDHRPRRRGDPRAAVVRRGRGLPPAWRQGLLDGVLVADFVFTPLCALLAVRLAMLPAQAAAVVVLLVELTVLLAGIVLETRPLQVIDRLLVAIAVVLAIPVVNELLLGQVTILIAASIYPLRDHDGRSRGIPFGIALALVPKPLLLPLLVWMVVWRRQALAGALVTAALLTGVGLLLLGPAAYGDWFAALQGAGEVSRNGNFSVWTDGVTPFAMVLAAAIVATFVVALHDRRLGFVAALPAGILLAPYSLTYALSILVLVLRPALAAAPRALRLLAISTNLAVIMVPFIWAAGWLVLPLLDRRMIGRVDDD